MIPQDFIDQLLARVDIVDVVERYVPLKKAGQNYTACCPFHKEKSPSFTVSPSKQFYHCFGCGANGSAINFVMEHGGLGFVDAVTELAVQVGLSVPQQEVAPEAQGRARKALQLQEYLNEATAFYKRQLKQTPDAVNYLKSRGLTGEVAARFGLGYAPAGWTALAGAFDDYLDDKLVEVGLVLQRDDGSRYDRFRERVMFPIRNIRGTVIGFGGRVLGQGEPKYLNSPETPLFEKGQELYGLFEARQAIRERDRVVVVEGYMDVVALAQYGVEYGVATLGTATTATHAQKLLRQADHVYFCFDGDQAGRRAAWRALENSLEALVDGKALHFLFLPPEHDPDSYIRAYGVDAFEQALMQDSIALSTYLVRELAARSDMASPEGRADLIRRAKPLVLRVKAPTLALMMRKTLAEAAQVELAELERLWGIRRGMSGRVGGAPRAMGAERAQLPLVRRLLRAIVLEPARATHVASLPEPDTLDGEARLCAELVQWIQVKGAPRDTAHLLEALRDSELGTRLEPLVSALLSGAVDLGDGEEAEFNDTLARFMHQLEVARYQRLTQKASVGTLSPEEKRLLLELLGRTHPSIMSHTDDGC